MTVSSSASPASRTCKLVALLRRPARKLPPACLAPATTAEYADQHDAAMLHCLARLLGHADAPLPPEATRTAHLALRFGGRCFRAASHDRYAAYWASWMDTLPVIRLRAPSVFDRLMQCLRAPAAQVAAVMSVRSRCIFLLSHQPLARCCSHRPDHTPHEPSRFCLPPRMYLSPRPTFGFSSSVAFASPCRWASVPAPAAPLVPRLASSPPEPFRSSGPSRGSAKKPEPALVVTLLYVIGGIFQETRNR